jgi:hypothetical protein
VLQGDTTNLMIRLASSASEVSIRLFTTAYRKVSETVLKDVPAGVHRVEISLRDPKGGMLANGCYHLVVVTPRGRAIGKLLILR